MSTNTAGVWIRAPHGYADEPTRKALANAVRSKLGLSELDETWTMVGWDAIGTYTVTEHPPLKVSLADITTHADACAEHEFVVGLAAGDVPVTISLAEDAPHFACSAGSGGGKTILAMTLAIQVLRCGGRVLILDTKGSHRWAMGLPGVTYCTDIPAIHGALVGTADLAQTRNSQALIEPEDWDPGDRVFVIFEEMNSTVRRLRNYWDAERDRLKHENKTRKKADPHAEDEYIAKTSPAIQGFQELMTMGRSAKVNLFGVAQMLTVAACGSNDARENFGVRCLTRYTKNTWRMLVPQCAWRPPPAKKHHGRWQIVTGGDTATETQVPFDARPDGKLDTDTVRAFALGGRVPSTTPPTVNPPSQTTANATQRVVVEAERLLTAVQVSTDEGNGASGRTFGAIRQAKHRATRRGDTWPDAMTEQEWLTALGNTREMDRS